MKIIVKGIHALIVLVLLSCSKDDSPEIDTLSEPDISVTLIGEDSERVYQFKYDSANKIWEQFDLTQEIGIGGSYLTLRQNGDLVSFYAFSSGNFSLFQKNVVTGTSSVEANFYAENQQRNTLWGTNDEKNIYLGFFAPPGTRNFGVLTINIDSGAQTELIIDFDIQTSYQPIYHQGKLILTYRDASDDYKVAVVDTASNSIIALLEFGALVPNIFIDDFGDVVILKSNQGENYSYTIYDANAFDPRSTADFSLTRYFDPGSLTARLIGEKLFYFRSYVQPAEVRFGPASFDFSTDSEILLDMERIVNEVEENNGNGIQLISHGIDETTKHYLVGYKNVTSLNNIDGGMMVISYDGELIENVELPFVPTYFLTKE